VGATEDNTRPVFDYDLVYDPLGNVSSRTYPRCTFNFCSGSSASPLRTVTGTFAEGLLTALPGYASAITYHPNGLVAQVSHTNGVSDVQEKDPTDMARPARLRTSGASEGFDTGVYSWDGAGNVTQMGSHRFVYDLLSRVTEGQVEIPGTGCGEELLLQSGTETGTVTRESCGTVRAEGSYRVGATGNVTLRAGHRVVLGDGFSVASGGRLTVGTDPALDPQGEPKDAGQSYTYDRFGNLLTVTTAKEGASPVTRTIATSSSTNRLTVATYDLSGNVTTWAGRQYLFDPFNMLWQTKPTSGNGVTFLYGPGDERLWTIDWTAGAAASSWVQTWTLRDLDGSPLRQFRNLGENTTAANWSFHRDYVYRGGALLAAHTPEGLHHFHLDHLGSPRLITGANGTTLAQHLYFPFGEEATNPGQDDEALQFTGHERDDLDLGAARALGEVLDRVPVAVTGGEVHLAKCARGPERRVDETHALHELRPVEPRDQAHARDHVSDRHVHGRLALVFQPNGFLGGGPLGRQQLLEPCQRGRRGRVLVPETLEQLDLAGGRQRQAVETAERGGGVLGALLAEPQQAVGQLVGFLARGAALNDLFRQATEVLDEQDPERDRHRPQLAECQRLDTLVGDHQPAQALGVEPAVGVRDVSPGEAEDPRIPLQVPVGELRQLPVVVTWQVVADLAELLLDDVEVVDQPFGRRGDGAFLADGLADGAIRGEQHPAVIPEPRHQRSTDPRPWRHALRRREAFGMLLQALDAEQFAADGLFGFARGSGRQTFEELKD